MISLDFEKGTLLPSLTLVELGNMAFAQDNEGPIYESCEDPNSVAHYLPWTEKKMCFAYNEWQLVTSCDEWENECCPIPDNPYCPGQPWD